VAIEAKSIDWQRFLVIMKNNNDDDDHDGQTEKCVSGRRHVSPKWYGNIAPTATC